MRRPTIALLLAVGVALAGCGGVAGPSADVAADKALNGPPVAELMAEGPLGERVLGNPNAPITVIEYASLTCPHCAHFQRDVFPRVKKEFIDTGKIRFIVQGVSHRSHLRGRGHHHSLRAPEENISSCSAPSCSASRNG